MSENNTQNQESTRQASSNFWKWCWKLGLIMLLPIGFLVWICLFHDTPPEISKETTYITSPLTEDGRVDYFRALEQAIYPPDMKTDKNGYRMIVRALGPVSDTYGTDPDLLKQWYEKLGLDPTVKPTMAYEYSMKFLERYVVTHRDDNEEKQTNPEPTLQERTQVEKLDNRAGQPWTPEDLPMMVDWLKQNGPALDVVAKSVRKPTFCIPLALDNQEEILFCTLTPSLEQLQRFRSYARGFSNRANYRIGTGNLDGAIDDIISCNLLGRHASKRKMIIDNLIGISIEGFGDSINLAGSLEHQPSKAQLRRFAKELENLPARGSFEESLAGERYIMLDIVQYIFQIRAGKVKGLSDDLKQIVPEYASVLGFDWNAVMRRVNWNFDDSNRLEQIPKRFHRSNGSPWLSPAMLLPTPRSELLGDSFLAMPAPGYTVAQKALRRAECAERVQMITLAMLLYEKDHGRLPPAYTIDKAGKPLHSWRVLLLPYLGKKAKKLFDKIKLDEPWDSPHNKRFHTAAVEFYQCPSSKLEPGETTYSVVVGKKTAFQPGEGKKLDQFGPESATMILVIENHTPCNWMDPLSDLTETNVEEIFEKEPVHSGVLTLGLRGGGILPITTSFDPEKFQKGLEGTDHDWENYD